MDTQDLLKKVRKIEIKTRGLSRMFSQVNTTLLSRVGVWLLRK